MKEWSLIIDPVPCAGSWNMAADEHLFESLDEAGETVVRFYRWARPTVSLGYSQSVERTVDLEFCRKNEIDVVRRMTGGKLVLHDKEITYSVVSTDASIFSSTLASSYRLISAALVRGLQSMGLPAALAGPPPEAYRRGVMPCFSYPARDEIEINGRKVVGSAQKRVGSRFLQHGSIPLDADPDRERRIAAVSMADPANVRVISLSEALGRPVTFDWAVGRLVDALASSFEVCFRPRSLSSEEIDDIGRIERQRYANPEWTLGRPRG
jgi:lipoyl(octanoyl) transferase